MSQIRTELEILLNIGQLSIVNQIGLIRSRPCEVVLNINHSFVFGPRSWILLPTAGRLLHFWRGFHQFKANRVQYTLRNGSVGRRGETASRAVDPCLALIGWNEKSKQYACMWMDVYGGATSLSPWLRRKASKWRVPSRRTP
jgi:hypothetical protein